jgi:hypothetical protein
MGQLATKWKGRQSFRLKDWWWIFPVTAAALGIVYMENRPPEPNRSAPASAEPDDAEPSDLDREALRLSAFEVCKDFVRDRLKAPSTASFPDFFDNDGEVNVAPTSNGTHNVISTVDSENSFGANLRLAFTCEVRNTDGDNWRLIELDIIE